MPVHVNAPEPNTWRELLEALKDRSERKIAIQEYGRSNEELIAALRERGAEVLPVPVYAYELPEDVTPLREAVTRLEQMVAMGGVKISPEAVRGQIASAVGMVVQAARLSDGKRKVMSVTEITGMEGNVVQMQEIFAFHRTHTGEDGTVHGEFRASGLRPRCLEEMHRRGIKYDTNNFDPTKVL